MSDTEIKGTVAIRCTGTDLIPMEELKPFQGKLKKLSELAYQELKKSILDLGFSFPVAAWKENGKAFILDAHQRIVTLKRMQKEGYVVPPVPVIWVEATDRREAARKLLAATSQFGEILPDTLYAYMKEMDISMADLDGMVRFPEIDLPSFELTFFPKTEIVQFEAKKQWKGMPEFENPGAEPFRSLIVHFYDEQGFNEFLEKTGMQVTEKTKFTWYPEFIKEVAMDKRYGQVEA